MNKIKALIVEDKEPQMNNLIAALKEHCPDVNVIGKATNCEEALRWLSSVKPDLIFMDIELPDGEGFSILQKYDNPSVPVIFVTGMTDHWQRAFEMSATAYLIKPIDPSKLKLAVEKAMIHRSIPQAQEQFEIIEKVMHGSSSRPKIGLRTNGILHFYYLDDLLYVSASGEKTFFRVNEDDLIEQPGLISEYEKLFEPYNSLMRVHRSTIINIHKISKYNSVNGDIVLEGTKTVLKVGDNYKKRFEDRMKLLDMIIR